MNQLVGCHSIPSSLAVIYQTRYGYFNGGYLRCAPNYPPPAELCPSWGRFTQNLHVNEGRGRLSTRNDCTLTITKVGKRRRSWACGALAVPETDTHV
ncbi:hypothetical protein Zmor_000316 [Zophobas morio]|uniref:Uncharacterized protein n=1 Tax=Zophobas morio TaxID=2755281 RepID=A0AA38IZU9_9CUCU|nr:hypothetical protein Zmor_000316 [Zophobas morio]